MVVPTGSALLELEGVGKTFANGTQALCGVDLVVAPGRVHGVVGANGAGKSTLIEIVAGAERPTEGTLRWRGADVSTWSPRAAIAAGVGTIHQSVPLVPEMSVRENVFLGEGSAVRRVPGREQRDRFDEITERSGIDIDPEAPVSGLPVGRRQLVGLLKVLAQGASLVVLDEPTASLSQVERELVFDVVRRLRSSGTGFIYVSHHMAEIFDLSDEVTVLRDGAVVGRHSAEVLDPELILHEMTGSAWEIAARAAAAARADTDTESRGRLEIRDVITAAGTDGVSLQVGTGEIVGIFGMIGSGRTELLRAIFGADRRGGEVCVDGEAVGPNVPDAVAAGIAFISEDRRAEGLFLDWEVWRNTSIVDLVRLCRRRVISGRAEVQRAEELIDRLDIRTPSTQSPVRTLSGGNQQKVAFAKWVAGDYSVFLLDEPTVAVDVRAKAQIIDLVRELAEGGSAVLINSSEPEELLAVADRILVMARGGIVAERPAEATSENELLALATGVSR